MGGVIACVFGHKSTEVQVDDESPPAAVHVDLLPRTSVLLPLKYREYSESYSTTKRAAGFMKGNGCTELFSFIIFSRGKCHVPALGGNWTQEAGRRAHDNIWM